MFYQTGLKKYITHVEYYILNSMHLHDILVSTIVGIL